MAQAGPAVECAIVVPVRNAFTFRAQPHAVPCWHGRSPWMVAIAAHLERQPNGRSFFAGSNDRRRQFGADWKGVSPRSEAERAAEPD